MHISISSTFVDPDAMHLVLGLHDAIRDGTTRGVDLDCIISTRQIGDNAQTDRMLGEVMGRVSTPVVSVSAKRFGRLIPSPSDGQKDAYDRCLMEEIERRVGRLPDVDVMLGDMIVRGPYWCSRLPSLNLHPDLPLAMGGVEGIYWDVVGAWIRNGRREIGGMMHLAVPTLDTGTPVAYFRLPANGIVNGVDLGELWEQLPPNEAERAALIGEQTALRDRPTHDLFKALRRAEAAFESKLVLATVDALARGEVNITYPSIVDAEGNMLTAGYDLTAEVVGEAAVWPGKEGISLGDEGGRAALRSKER